MRVVADFSELVGLQIYLVCLAPTSSVLAVDTALEDEDEDDVEVLHGDDSAPGSRIYGSGAW
jgi:hypothetical protein